MDQGNIAHFDRPRQPASLFGDVVPPGVNRNPRTKTGLPDALDIDQAIGFLQALDPHGWHNLVAISLSGSVNGKTFAPGDWGSMSEWIASHHASNLYYALNEPSAEAPDGKLGKGDIGSVRCIYSDLDPDLGPYLSSPATDDQKRFAFARAREDLSTRIRAQFPGAVSPSFFIDSGNGLQCIWMLECKLPAAECRGWAETTGANLAALLTGDKVQNIDRIFRLPGSLNYPTETKRRKGLIDIRPAKVVSGDGSRAFSIDGLNAIIPSVPLRPEMADADLRIQAASNEIGDIELGLSYDDLDADLRSRFEKACKLDWKLQAAWEGKADGLLKSRDTDQSGSQFRAAIAARLGETGQFTAADYAELACTCPHLQSSLEKAAREGGLRRALSRDWGRIAAPVVEKLTQHFEAEATPHAIADSVAARITAASAKLGGAPLDIFGDDDPSELGGPSAQSLPSVIERWAISEARRKGVPVAFAALAAVTAVGAAIGSDIRIQVRQRDDSWTEGANLYSVLVADPGSAKSPTIAAALAEMRAVDAVWMKQDASRHAEWSKLARKRGKDIPDAGPEPRIRRALVDDVTAEKMIRIFADNPRGILRAPDELAGLIGSFGAYKSGGDADRSHFLRSFDGGSVTYDRVGAGTIHADKAALSVLAGTQPDKLQAVVKNLGADGLLQRFIVVLHDGVDREALDEEPDRDAAKAYADLIRTFLSAEYPFPPTVRMDPHASAHFEAAWREMQKIKHLPGAHSAFAGHIEKWGKILPRLILIFHAVDLFERFGRIDPAQSVMVDTVEKAVNFARFLLRHAIQFYRSYFDASEAFSEARWIGGHLLTRPDLESVRRRDIYDARKTLRGPEGAKSLLAAMSQLETAGWVQVSERSPDGPTAWSVNERIHARFAERGERERRERALRQEKIIAAGESRKWVSGAAELQRSQPQPSAFD
jgi:hypothetical protein